MSNSSTLRTTCRAAACPRAPAKAGCEKLSKATVAINCRIELEPAGFAGMSNRLKADASIAWGALVKCFRSRAVLKRRHSSNSFEQLEHDPTCCAHFSATTFSKRPSMRSNAVSIFKCIVFVSTFTTKVRGWGYKNTIEARFADKKLTIL